MELGIEYHAYATVQQKTLEDFNNSKHRSMIADDRLTNVKNLKDKSMKRYMSANPNIRKKR